MNITYMGLHSGLTVRGLAWVLIGLGSTIGLGACTPETTPEKPETAAVAVETYMVGDIEVRTDGLSARDDAYRVDEITFELEPGEGFEYKYRLEKGETMVYSWVSASPVRSEMHSEADDQAEGTAEFWTSFTGLPKPPGRKLPTCPTALIFSENLVRFTVCCRVRRRCTMNSGWPESACTSSSR